MRRRRSRAPRCPRPFSGLASTARSAPAFVRDRGALKLLDFGIAKRRDDDVRDDSDASSGPSAVETLRVTGATVTGESPFVLLSAVVLAGGTHVYGIDRRDLGHLFVATRNETGTAFGPKRVVATEPLGALPPLATQLTDGRTVLLWGATMQGNPVLRLAPILPDGELEGALESRAVRSAT